MTNDWCILATQNLNSFTLVQIRSILGLASNTLGSSASLPIYFWCFCECCFFFLHCIKMFPSFNAQQSTLMVLPLYKLKAKVLNEGYIFCVIERLKIQCKWCTVVTPFKYVSVTKQKFILILIHFCRPLNKVFLK